MKKSVLATIALSFLCSYALFAQGITIFWDENYSGPSFVINGDWDATSNMKWNDQISSIRVPAGYKIQVFEHTNFGGVSKILTRDWTVAGREFNDFISSIRILEYPKKGITLFWDANFSGKSVVINSDWDASSNMEWNDQISSIKIPAGYKIQVFEHIQFGGASKILSGDWTVSGSDFNDFISSIRIIETPMMAGRGQQVKPNEAKNKLCCDREIPIGGSLESPSGRYFLAFQADRNFVLYKRVLDNDVKPLWATATNNNADRCVMQADGNLVLYNGARAVWTSNTFNNPNAVLTMQDDGNLVIYSTDGRSLWQSNTAQMQEEVVVNDRLCCDQPMGVEEILESANKRFFLAFQGDRNLVVYMRTAGATKPLWATATNNNADRVVMQADGNLVVYNGSRPVWTSNTSGNTNAKLVMQDDGNLVIYANDGRAVWHSNTAQATQPAPVVVTPVVLPTDEKTLPVTTPCAMPDQQFKAAVHAVEAQSFRDGKMKMAKQAVKNKCLSLNQIRAMAKLFSFEDQRLDFLKYTYDFTNSKDDYYTLADIFSFKSNSDDFMAFLETK